MIVGMIILIFIIIVGVTTFIPDFPEFIKSKRTSDKNNKAKRKIIFSGRFINIMCFLGVANHILKLINLLIAPESSTIEIASKYIWYYPYIWIYNISMIIAYYFIWKRKKLAYIYILLALLSHFRLIFYPKHLKNRI